MRDSQFTSYPDDGVIVTENETRAQRPDNTIEQSNAEARVTQVIKDLGDGLISRSSSTKVRDAADRSVKSHDLSRGINNRGE